MDDKTYEIEIGDKAVKGIPLPVPPSRVFSITPRAHMFISQAKKLMHKAIRDEQNFVPLISSYALYDDMNPSQKNWYFYWRNKARHGEFLSSGINYINLYINEILNGIGVSNKYDGLSKLLGIWKAYEGQHSELNEYLPTWIMDYFLMHNISDKACELVEHQWTAPELDILMTIIPNKIDLLKSFHVINIYSGYKLKNSTFFRKAENSDKIIEAIENIFIKLEMYFIEKQNASIVEKYTPYYNSKISRQVFRGALYSDTAAINIKYKNFSHCKELSDFIGNIIKYTENIIRELSGSKPNLKTTFITQSYMDIINDVLYSSPSFKHSKNIKKQTVDVPKIITVDIDKVNRLINETNEIQKLLIAEQSSDQLESSAISNNEGFYEQGSHENAVSSINNANTTIVDDIISESAVCTNVSIDTTENQEHAIYEIIKKLSRLQLDMLKLLSEDGGEAEASALAISNNTLQSKIFDDINEISYDIINDMIIDTLDKPTLYEEYAEQIKAYFSIL